jgi:hypothetical protein
MATQAALWTGANSALLWQDGGATALRLMADALLSALAFVLANSLLTATANVGHWQRLGRDPKSRARLANLALVYFLGLLPALLLAPLGSVFGLVILLPFLAMLLLSAQILRLQLDVTGLRRQLRTAEAMGRASIHEEDTNLDPATLLKRFLRLARALGAQTPSPIGGRGPRPATWQARSGKRRVAALSHHRP